MDRDAEVRRLNVSERHIAIVERQLAAQAALPARLGADGHRARDAERWLANVEGLPVAMRGHRSPWLEVLRLIDAGEL